MFVKIKYGQHTYSHNAMNQPDTDPQSPGFQDVGLNPYVCMQEFRVGRKKFKPTCVNFI